MQVQTLPLTAIAAAWSRALAGSAPIVSFCSRYERQLQVFVGVNRKRPPTDADCPYIVIRPGAKEEGEVDPFRYVISVGWAIKNEAETQFEGVVEQAGITECDQLGQLIYAELADLSPSSPVTRCNYELEAIEFWPQFVGDMELEISITPTIGGAITY